MFNYLETKKVDLFLFFTSVAIFSTYLGLYYNNFTNENKIKKGVGIQKTGESLAITGITLFIITLFFSVLNKFINLKNLEWKKIFSTPVNYVLLFLFVVFILCYIIDHSLTSHIDIINIANYTNNQEKRKEFLNNWINFNRGLIISSSILVYYLLKYNNQMYKNLLSIITFSLAIILLYFVIYNKDEVDFIYEIDKIFNYTFDIRNVRTASIVGYSLCIFSISLFFLFN